MIRRHSTFIMIIAPFVVLNLITIIAFGGKAPTFHLWLLPVYYLLTAVALRILTLCFPASSSSSNTRALNFLLGGVAMFLLIHHIKLMTFAWTLTPKTHQGFEYLALISFMTLLGLSFMASTPNPVLGIPTPWARASADNWRRTHKFAGMACLVSGMILQGNLLFRNPIIPASSMIGIILASVFYSYQLHKGSKAPPAS
jgi:uncharacterized membrane protein